MRRILAVLVLLLLPLTAVAHDYWLSPDRFTLEPGKPPSIDLLLGGHFVREQARTDDEGIARFSPKASGAWLLRMVHMRPCECSYTDWESYWTSFSFVRG